MARLPEVSDLGRRPVPRSGRGIAAVSNPGAVGQAVSRLGDAAFSALSGAADRQADFELAEAKSAYLRQGMEAEDEVRKSPEWDKWGEAYGERTTALRGKVSEGLTGGYANRAFELWAADVDTRNQARIRDGMEAKRVDDGKARLSTMATANLDAAVMSPDPAFREDMLTITMNGIDGAVANGTLTKEGAVTMKREAAVQFASRRLSVMPPEERLKELDGGTLSKYLPPDAIELHRQKARDDLRVQREGDAQARGRQAGLAAADTADALASGDIYRQAAIVTVQLESGGKADAKNPNSTAEGAGQFVDATWLDVMRRARPELVAGKTEAEILAMRGDANLSLQMTEEYARQNGRALQLKGFEPTVANLYLAHFMGAGGATDALAASPDAPISTVMSDKAMAANAGIRSKDGRLFATWTVGDLIEWSADKTGKQPRTAGDMVLAIKDPTERAAAAAELSRVQAIRGREAEQRRAQLEELAFSFVNSGRSVLDLPMKDQNSLGREAMSSLISYEQKIAAGQKPETDPGFYSTLMETYATDPEAFKAQSPMLWVSRLDPQDYQKMVDRQAALKQGTAPDRTPRAISTIMSQASARLRSAGFDVSTSATGDDAKKIAQFQTDIIKWQEGFLAKNERTPTMGETDDRINQMLVEISYDPPFAFNSKSGEAFQFDYGSITPEGIIKNGITIGEKDIDPKVATLAALQFTEAMGRSPSTKELIDLLIEGGAHLE